MYKLDDLQKKKVADLKEIATNLNLKKFEKLAKTDLIYKILDEQATTSSKEVKETVEIKSTPKNTPFTPLIERIFLILTFSISLGSVSKLSPRELSTEG